MEKNEGASIQKDDILEALKELQKLNEETESETTKSASIHICRNRIKENKSNLNEKKGDHDDFLSNCTFKHNHKNRFISRTNPYTIPTRKRSRSENSNPRPASFQNYKNEVPNRAVLAHCDSNYKGLKQNMISEGLTKSKSLEDVRTDLNLERYQTPELDLSSSLQKLKVQD